VVAHTASTTVGHLVFGECRQEAGSRPTLLVRTCGEGGPHQLDGGQAQLAQQEFDAGSVVGVVARHAATSRLDQRLARWLLMAHDRIEDDLLPLTHEFLSLMLGVRRLGVTETLNALQKQGLISGGRRGITVKDRKGMERFAGEAYGVPESEYRRLVG